MFMLLDNTLLYGERMINEYSYSYSYSFYMGIDRQPVIGTGWPDFLPGTGWPDFLPGTGWPDFLPGTGVPDLCGT